MKYSEYIQGIIDTRGQWNIPEGDYFEPHHIVPVSMGGLPKRLYKGDRKRNNLQDNIIWLYPDEHYIAHELLAKENPESVELIRAWNIMSHKNGVKIDSDEYNDLMIQYHKLNRGDNAPFAGKHHSSEYCKAISDRVSGKNNPMYGMKGTLSPRYGQKATEESRAKMRAAKAKGFVPWNKGKTGLTTWNKGMNKEEMNKYRENISKKGGDNNV